MYLLWIRRGDIFIIPFGIGNLKTIPRSEDDIIDVHLESQTIDTVFFKYIEARYNQNDLGSQVIRIIRRNWSQRGVQSFVITFPWTNKDAQAFERG